MNKWGRRFVSLPLFLYWYSNGNVHFVQGQNRAKCTIIFEMFAQISETYSECFSASTSPCWSLLFSVLSDSVMCNCLYVIYVVFSRIYIAFVLFGLSCWLIVIAVTLLMFLILRMKCFPLKLSELSPYVLFTNHG